MLHSENGLNLEVQVLSAHDLDDVERFGQNDAYVRVGLDLNKDFTKTAVKKGTNPTWDSILLLRDFRPETHLNLYVEVMDEESGPDEIIAFAAIPLNQVLVAHESKLSAKFELFTRHYARKGEISLTIRALPLGQEAGSSVSYVESNKKGHSQLLKPHQDRIDKVKLKEHLGDAAKALGAAAAVTGLAYGILHGKEKKPENV
ncbi:hypothetical protein BGX28_010287 [Mortierella sp. GBA30]|nr:hypothetical protein BGX28_010287 [Mortierella sp. GBA30]